MSSTALSSILTRICALETETIAGSVAFTSAWVQTQQPLYWTNKVDVTGFGSLGAGSARFTATVQMRLHRCKFTEIQVNDSLVTQCYDDLASMMRALGRKSGRDFITAAYPTRYPNLLPQSETPVTGVLAVIPAPDGTVHFGAVITISFAYTELGAS